MEALLSTVGNALKGKSGTIHKYPKEPFKLNSQNDSMSEYEVQRQVDKFFAEQEAMRVNFRRNKNK